MFLSQPEPGHESGSDSSTHDIHVATCALLLEIAQIDGEFSETEQKNIVDLLRNRYNLEDEYIAEITAAAQEERESSHDLWQFTDLINRNYGPQKKMEIIELVWEVIYIDGHLDKHEDYLVHKLARLLNLQHSELIEAKLRVLYKDN